MPGDPAPVVTESPERKRFEVSLDGEQAGYAEYELFMDGKVIDFTHTKIDERFEGRGVASTLIRAALDTARERGLEVIPHCPFVRSYIERHDDYLDLVPQKRRQQLGLQA